MAKLLWVISYVGPDDVELSSSSRVDDIDGSCTRSLRTLPVKLPAPSVDAGPASCSQTVLASLVAVEVFSAEELSAVTAALFLGVRHWRCATLAPSAGHRRGSDGQEPEDQDQNSLLHGMNLNQVTGTTGPTDTVTLLLMTVLSAIGEVGSTVTTGRSGLPIVDCRLDWAHRNRTPDPEPRTRGDVLV